MNVVQVDLKIEPITGLDATKVAVSLVIRLNFEPSVSLFNLRLFSIPNMGQVSSLLRTRVWMMIS